MADIGIIIDTVNDFLWSYVLVVMLALCAVFFTLRTRFVQFRMIGSMVRLLLQSDKGGASRRGRHISSFQAFIVSLASRIGTGNLAGVATAISVGGPGAVFWMWVMALVGSASAFVESTLAQLYKRRSKDSFIGGPAYYMKHGLHCRWMGSLFAVLMILTFALANSSVQSNTICAAWDEAFGIDVTLSGIVLTAVTLLIIFGGIHRVAKVSVAIVPFMAVGYMLVAVVIIIINIRLVPSVIVTIVESAFGIGPAAGGMMGAAVMNGVKRGLFSNEAGEGSAPHAAATASVSHPVKQGLIQALGVFTDTLVVCSCTAFIILISGADYVTVSGIQLTQNALTGEIGAIGGPFIAVAILLFAFSTVIGNYYYGESNVRYLTSDRRVLLVYRLALGAIVMLGAIMTLDMAWRLVDFFMALLTACNLVAITPLSRHVVTLLRDFRRQLADGKDPSFNKESMPDVAGDLDAW